MLSPSRHFLYSNLYNVYASHFRAINDFPSVVRKRLLIDLPNILSPLYRAFSNVFDIHCIAVIDLNAVLYLNALRITTKVICGKICFDCKFMCSCS